MTSDSFQHKRVLITGGTGFIGAHLTNGLAARGALVTALSRSGMCAVPVAAASVNTVQAPLAEALAIRKVVAADYDFIFHLAGNSSVAASLEDPFADLNANARDTLALLENMRQTGARAALVCMSSIAVYGNPSKMPILESDPVNPISPYGASKLAAENYIRMYCQLYDLNAAILRVGSAYGPGQRKMAIYELMSRLKTNPHALAVEGDGTQQRDFVHVSDVIAALELGALRAGRDCPMYNVASGISTSIRELIELICAAAGLQPQVTFTNVNAAGKPARWQISIEKIRSIGFNPRVGLATGLKENWDWLA